MSSMATITIVDRDRLCGLTQLCESINYVIKYDDFVATLHKKANRVLGELDRVQYLVDEALRNGENISPRVTNWQKRLKEVKKSAYLIERAHDLPTWFNIVRRYKIAKTANNLTWQIHDLLMDGVDINRRSLLQPEVIVADQYKALPSRERLLNEMREELLGEGDDPVLGIGVYGEKGVGKTTLVRKLAELMIEEFEGVVMVSCKEMEEKGMVYIQDVIAARIGFEFGDSETTLETRATRVHQMLSEMGKVLIIVDDFDEMVDLTLVGVPWPSRYGCRIVVVSRNYDEYEVTGTQMTVEVKPLLVDESLDLLRKLVVEYDFASTYDILRIAGVHLSSKPTWLPGEIRDYLFELLGS